MGVLLDLAAYSLRREPDFAPVSHIHGNAHKYSNCTDDAMTLPAGTASTV